MSDGRKTKLQEAVHLPKLKVAEADKPLTPVQAFLQRTAEVTQKDHEEFSEYLEERRARDRPPVPQATPPSRINRRSVLKWAAGTAVVGEAAVVGHQVITGQDVPSHGTMHSGASPAEALRHHVERELVNPQAEMRGRSFGNWVLLMPTKLAGGTYAVNLNTGRTLAWISYWNYGDFNPISHHLCAFPSADPTKGFEWINSTQGGKNSLIYGIPTNIEVPGEGFNIYRVRFDGAQMELMENVSETTGLGLGVHVTIDPEECRPLFRHRRAEGHRGLLRPQNLAGDRGAQIRLGAECPRSRGGLAEGRRPEDFQDLSRPGDRQVRLSRHQGPEDRMGNGADGRIVRRGRDHSRRRHPRPLRRRRHHLASDRPLGIDRRQAVRRPSHPRCREELRTCGVPSVQQGCAEPVSRSPKSTTTTGR